MLPYSPHPKYIRSQNVSRYKSKHSYWNLALTIRFHGLNLLSYGLKPVIYLECSRKDCTKHLCLGHNWNVKTEWSVSTACCPFTCNWPTSMCASSTREESFLFFPPLVRILYPQIGARQNSLQPSVHHLFLPIAQILGWCKRVCAKGKYLTAVSATIAQPLSDPALISWEFQGFESDWIKILFLQVDEGSWLMWALVIL